MSGSVDSDLSLEILFEGLENRRKVEEEPSFFPNEEGLELHRVNERDGMEPCSKVLVNELTQSRHFFLLG